MTPLLHLIGAAFCLSVFVLGLAELARIALSAFRNHTAKD